MAQSHNKDTDHKKDNDLPCCSNFDSLRQTLDEMDFERGIWSAAKDGDLERVEMLLRSGVSANAKDSAGYSPLHYSARNGHYRVCEVLLNHGADVDANTRSMGATPLHRAAAQGRTEVASLLLERGADPNKLDADGKTPLHRAFENYSNMTTRICSLLINVTDLSVADKYGQTIMDLVQKYGGAADRNHIERHWQELRERMTSTGNPGWLTLVRVND